MKDETAEAFEVLIIGGGPAGLSAALILGRCCRRVCLIDAGQPRNIRSRALHGFLSRDGMPPAEFLELARGDVRKYPNVKWRNMEAVACNSLDHRFRVRLADDASVAGQLLLLATGVVDRIPPLEGIMDFYGATVHHCPYCDGWEHRGNPVAVYGKGDEAALYALEMTAWTDEIVLCTDGPSELNAQRASQLSTKGIPVVTGRVSKLIGSDDQIEAVAFEDGSFVRAHGFFFVSGEQQASGLAAQLQCTLCPDGSVETDDHGETSVSGVYAAGNTSKGLQMVIMAAAEGAKVAHCMNEALLAASGCG